MLPSRFQIGHGDAVRWLRTLPDASVDLVITDPPYESLEKHRAVGTTTRLKHSKASSNDWFEIFPNSRFPELFAEVYRVLRPDSHFYLYCDPETMFVAKPLGEAAGFKFWKPLIWDKCLGPDTLVWTERGVLRIADVVVGDRVALPEGGTTVVAGVRSVRSPALRVQLSDGSDLLASREHRLMRSDGALVEAGALRVGDALMCRPVRQRGVDELELDDVIPDHDAVYELPTTSCLWCQRTFDSSRAAAAHQARWCEFARSKASMAEGLGLSAKRLRRWIGQGRVPKEWATKLGIEHLGQRQRCMLQNDAELWYPRTLRLDHELGKIVGLFAAEGSQSAGGVTFALHRDEKHLQSTIARFARRLGLRAMVRTTSDAGVTVDVSCKLMGYLMRHFVAGSSATTKALRPAVYSAPAEFRRGVLAGLLEGDGHWSHDEQRQTFTSASADLAMFVYRCLASETRPRLRRVENEHAGAWVVTADPVQAASALTVVAVSDAGTHDLVDIAVTDSSHLFLLGNGVVTHNCQIGMGYHYRARYECILFFEKGKRKLADLGVADVLTAPRVRGGYPAEKPPAVSEVLIRQSTVPGAIVVDPFMGSGSVGVAAVRQGREFWGNDLCAEACVITRDRLRDLGAVEQGRDGATVAATAADGQPGLSG